MLGLGRAMGETIAVALIFPATFDITFEILTPHANSIAANIANGFGEATQIGRGALIASGLVLFVITLLVNIGARLIINRRKEYARACCMTAIQHISTSRRIKDRVVQGLVYLAFALAVVPLVSVLWLVISNGLSRFDLEFLTHSMNGIGARDAAWRRLPRHRRHPRTGPVRLGHLGADRPVHRHLPGRIRQQRPASAGPSASSWTS